MASHAERGKMALDGGNFNEAVLAYTAAIQASETSPNYFIQRAIAYTRSRNYREALGDAEQGVINAHKRGSRDLIMEAQLRRGIALHQLERYGDAQKVLKGVLEMKKDHKQAATWLRTTEMSLAKIPDDDQRRVCTVEAMPASSPEREATIKASFASLQPADKKTSVQNDSTVADTSIPKAGGQTSLPPAKKITHSFYQSREKVYLDVMAKAVPKDQVKVDITGSSVNVSFPVQSADDYHLSLSPLYGSVKPEHSTYRVLPTKIEVILTKSDPGKSWPSLSGTAVAASTSTQGGPTPAKSTESASTKTEADVDGTVHMNKSKDTPPAYPTSSRSGPKNWDKITADLRRSEKIEKKNQDSAKDASTNESANHDDDPVAEDDDDDDEGGDPTNHFFKKLFKGASPDAQRAMMKSYTESNGTALSTNWGEVSKGTVETVPPDGMEAKEYSR